LGGAAAAKDPPQRADKRMDECMLRIELKEMLSEMTDEKSRDNEWL
jgi:hypothetical protein